MTILMQRMREELVRRNYAETTIRSYLQAVEAFPATRQKRRSITSDPTIFRRYHAYLLEDRKLASTPSSSTICALRFLYIKVLKRRDMKEDLPYPKRLERLPVVLSQDEVARLIDCGAEPFPPRDAPDRCTRRTQRRSELCRLKVSNIDSQRMMLRIDRARTAWIAMFP